MRNNQQRAAKQVQIVLHTREGAIEDWLQRGKRSRGYWPTKVLWAALLLTSFLCCMKMGHGNIMPLKSTCAKEVQLIPC